MTGIAALAMCAGFTSCSHDLSMPTQEDINQYVAQKVTDNYNRAFIDHFGEPSEDQDWGFGSASNARALTRANSGENYPATSEGINANANEWADPNKEFGGWVVPDALTDGQKERVRKYFQANPNLGNKDPQWRHFFVQQVYKGGSNRAGVSTENITAANGSVYNSDNMNLLTVGQNHQHINNFNAGNCSVNNKVLSNGGNVNNGPYHSDQIMLMVNIDDTSCFGYHETGSSTHHDNKWALVDAATIDRWAASNGNPGEAVVDKWNRSFMGFDLALKEGSEAYDKDGNGNINYSSYSQAPESPQYAWDGEKIIQITTGEYETVTVGNQWSTWTENRPVYKDEYKTIMNCGWLTTNMNFYVAADKVTLNQTISINRAQISSLEGIQNCVVLKEVMDGNQWYQGVINLPRIKQLVDNGYLPVKDKNLTEWVKVGTSDGYFTDWIVTLTKAERYQEEDFDVRIIAEDLTPGEDLDWDFNDVVFDVTYTSDTEATCTIQCAGGVLPLRVATKGNPGDGDWIEVHEKYGKERKANGKYDMINTGGASITINDKPTFTVTGITKSERGKDIKIMVDKGTVNEPNWIEITATKGQPAAKIAVNKGYKIVTERTDIRKVYTKFSEWVSDPKIIWY